MTAGRIGGYLLGGWFLGLCWLERRRRLRPPGPERPARRIPHNLALAALSALTLRLVERPLVGPLAQRVAHQRLGLLGHLPPGPLRGAVGLLLMDYSLYWWHVLLHRVPLLWRLHAVHHSDLELDTTTAARFHFGEFLASVPWRLAQVRLIGVGPELLQLWQRLTVAEVLFHHSDLRLPLALERRLSRLLVTPRLHGIHHSAAPEETDSNYSSGLTLWDALHRTLRLDVPQRAIRIGLPAYRKPLSLPRLLMLPLRRQGPAGRQSRPHPHDRRLPAARHRLAP